MKTWLFLCDSCWQARIVKRNRNATKTVEFPEKNPITAAIKNMISITGGRTKVQNKLD